MKGIVFTTEERDLFNVLVNSFYTKKYGSLDKLKEVENRNIALMPILNNLFVLSETFLRDKGYKDLVTFVLQGMELNVREINQDELIQSEEL
jgi:hypothetical protein